MNQEMIGKTIAGRYRILQVIGLGGLATVYKALDIRLKRIVALKVLADYLGRDVEFERRFQREAHFMMRLQHPNIVGVYEYGEADGLSYLVIEYIEGSSLAQILAEGKPLDVDYAIEIIRQVGEALSHAHRHGIIHRDIKPSNILISKDGRALLSDLGLAIAPRAPTTTAIGTILGTPKYMSPEQVMGKPVDPRSDIYSLGLVLYELLTGRPPLSAETPIALLLQHVHKPPPPLRQFNPAVPPALEQTVLRALAKDPKQRYQTVDEFVAALVRASEASVPRAEPPRSLRLPERHAVGIDVERAWRWAWIIGGLLGAAALTLVFGPTLWNWARNLPVLAVSTALAVLSILSLVLIARFRRRALLGPTPVELATAVPSPPPPGQAAPSIEPPSPTKSRPITGETIPYTPAPAPSTVMLRREPSAMAWLIMLSGPNRGHQFGLAETVTIGRDVSRCDIVLADATVSGQHAKIQLEHSHFYVYDLASTNGTFVNGLRVTRQELQDRDEIRMGNLIMLFIRVASLEDLTVEAKRRLREFDSIWDQLTRSVRHD